MRKPHAGCRTRRLGVHSAAVCAGRAAADVQARLHRPAVGRRRRAPGFYAQKTHQFYEIDAINAAGGLNGEKLQIVFVRQQGQPAGIADRAQEGARRGRALRRPGQRQRGRRSRSPTRCRSTTSAIPGKEVLFFNYAAIDPALTNEKCNFWHFRFDADVDMKMAAMTDCDRDRTEGQDASI